MIGLDLRSALAIKLVLIALVLLLPALPAFAADINVDNGCSLTQAINEANGLTSGVGSCEAGTNGSGLTGKDTIILPSGNSYTVSELSISSHIVIRAFGSLISGNNSNRVFSVTGAGSLTLTSAGVEKGRSNANGGAIYVAANGQLSLIDSSVRNSQAARGGGIYSDGGTVSINRGALHNNTAASTGNGGAIYMDGGSVTITNSSIYSNTGGRRGGGIYQTDAGGEGATGSLTLIHVTVTKNTASHSTGAAGVHAFRGSQTLRNSIIWGNTRSGAAANCTLNTVTALTNNVIGGGSSANCTASQITSDPRLSSSATGFVPYFTLGRDSSARDAAGDCTSLTTTDQTGVRTRPIGSACDIGAYEADVPPAVTATATATATATPTATATATATPTPTNSPTGTLTPSSTPTATATSRPGQPTSTMRPSSPRVREEATEIWRPPSATPTATPTRTPPPPTCLTLPSHISVRNITHSTQCQQVDAAGIGNAAVLGLGFRDGVDVWGWVLPDMQICFEGSSGSFRFLDAATAPRAVSELPAVGKGGMICTTINRAGTVAWVNGPPAPAPSATPPVYQSVSGCMARTQYILNFRAIPGGEVIDILPFNIKLTVLERTAGWYKVDYHGAQGWISADYVEPIGTCG